MIMKEATISRGHKLPQIEALVIAFDDAEIALTYCRILHMHTLAAQILVDIKVMKVISLRLLFTDHTYRRRLGATQDGYGWPDEAA